MHRTLLFVAYGWLALSGVLHFGIDVLSQHLRGVREPGPLTTSYYGLNTAYALGQLLLGLLALLVAWEAPEVLGRWPALTLGFAAAGLWLAFGVMFIEYPQPKYTVALFAVLLAASAAAKVWAAP